MIPSPIALRLLYALIFLSGASGLVYQVVWHKYLAILLGAQARATAIVLAIFLGGISVGYAMFGRWSRYKKWNLLLAYSLVEVGLGAWAFLFPFLFRGAMPLTAKLYSALGVNSLLIDIVMSIALIGLPTFLMGGTLPLLTQGLSRDLEEASRTHAKIYGFNTVGACVGCLAAGYVLVPSYGLAVTTTIGGFFNMLVGIVSYFAFARKGAPQEGAEAPPRFADGLHFTRDQAALLAVGFLSGFYLITLETVLIRLMGLSTGSSNYNFTLIVAIFIFGLGAGSLAVRDIPKYGVTRLFWNQVAVSFFLMLLYLSGTYWAFGVHTVRAMVRDLPEAFYLYQLLLGLGFTLLLIVPIGFSGLTLPLCFHLMKDSKESLGERVGQLYGVNTIGCVMGAIAGGYFFLNFIDLDQLFKVCVLLALGSSFAAAFLYVRRENPSPGKLSFASAVLAVVLMSIPVSSRWPKEQFIQPFRHPQPIENVTFRGPDAFLKYMGRSTELLYWKDGPNTSVGIGASKYQGKEISRTIFVNGKSDGNTRGDLFTTVMLAHIPALLGKKIERSCIIGLGTGITIGTLAQYPDVKTIDVAEISNFSIANASYFDPYNNGVSKDPKVHFHEMDAFRFLQGTTEKYDIVISEPSNPWVAGIENLYSSEFYDIALSKMEPEGIFVQWMHSYSLTEDLFRLVMRTMAGRFPYVTVFQLKGGDLALVGKREPFTKEDLSRAATRMRVSPGVVQALHEAGISRLETMLALEVIPHPLAKVMGEGLEEHTLESPKLSNEAAKAFFVGSSAYVQKLRRQYKEFYPAVNGSLLAMQLDGGMPSWELLESLRGTFCDSSSSKTNYLCEETLAMEKLMNREFHHDPKYDDVVTARDLSSLDVFYKDTPKKFTPADLQAVYSMFELYKKFASPIARIPASLFLKPVEYCMKTNVYADELYGECLLQKILVLETVQLPGPEFQSAVTQYLDWFPNLPKTSPNYAKLLEAKGILSQLASLGFQKKN